MRKDGILLGFFFCFVVFSCPEFGACGTDFEEINSPGSHVQVIYSIILEAGGAMVAGVSSEVMYDPALLRLADVVLQEEVRAVGKQVILNEVKPGHLRVGILGLNRQTIPDGLIAQIVFDKLVEGKLIIRNHPRVVDVNGRLLSSFSVGGKIKVVER